MNNFKLYILLSLIIFTSCKNQDCNSGRLLNTLEIDASIGKNEISNEICDFNNFNKGAEIILNKQDSSIAFVNAILNRKLLEINITNCSGWVGHKIRIQVVDSLFSVGDGCDMKDRIIIRQGIISCVIPKGAFPPQFAGVHISFQDKFSLGRNL